MTTATWNVLYPRTKGVWPGRRESTPVLFDPVESTIVEVDPRRDRDLGHLAGWMRYGRLISYRAGVRATVSMRLGNEAGYVKVLGDRRIKRLRESEVFIRQLDLDQTGTGSRSRVVGLCGVDATDGAVVYREAPGAALHTLLADHDPSEAIVRTGRAVATLHAAHPPIDPPHRSQHTIRQWAAWVRAHDPECPEWIVHDAMRVDDMASNPATVLTPVHGDLHDKNVFVSDGQVTFIDLASAHLGPPDDDIGMLAGHLVLRAVQRRHGLDEGFRRARLLIDAYAAAGGPATVDDATRAMIRTLARLSLLYRFRRRWHWITPTLAGAATARLR